MKQTNESSFDDVIKNENKLILIDFWGEWCGPCKMIKPILDELSNEYADKVSIFGIDVDDNPNITSSQGIRNIPTIGFYKNGVLVDRLVGAYPKSHIKSKIEELIQ